jgi:hypothetical protein
MIRPTTTPEERARAAAIRSGSADAEPAGGPGTVGVASLAELHVAAMAPVSIDVGTFKSVLLPPRLILPLPPSLSVFKLGVPESTHASCSRHFK